MDDHFKNLTARPVPEPWTLFEEHFLGHSQLWGSHFYSGHHPMIELKSILGDDYCLTIQVNEYFAVYKITLQA